MVPRSEECAGFRKEKCLRSCLGGERKKARNVGKHLSGVSASTAESMVSVKESGEQSGSRGSV